LVIRRCVRRRSRSGSRHFQSAACRDVIEIPAIRRDEELSSKEACSFTVKAPGYIGVFRFDLLQINSIRQKNREPRLRSHWFRMNFVNLDLDVASLHVHVGEAPLSQEHAPRIEFGGNAVSIERLHRLSSIIRAETLTSPIQL